MGTGPGSQLWLRRPFSGSAHERVKDTSLLKEQRLGGETVFWESMTETKCSPWRVNNEEGD